MTPFPGRTAMGQFAKGHTLNTTGSTKKLWEDSNYRKRQMEARNSLAFIEMQREGAVSQWNDFEKRERLLEGLRKVAIKRKSHPDRDKRNKTNSKMVAKLWQDPEYAKKQMRARHAKPNKAELKLNGILQQILPNEYKFVGDFSLIIEGRNPDFINVNGKKKIVELYGDYWHANPNRFSSEDMIMIHGETSAGDIWRDDRDKMALFKQYGYQALIVWESELKDENALKGKLLNFNEEKP